MGKYMKNDELEAMLNEQNVPKDGFINYEQFKVIMLAEPTNIFSPIELTKAGSTPIDLAVATEFTLNTPGNV
jgi:hypothetical protein